MVEELVEFVEEPGAASDKRTADREIKHEMHQPAGGDLPAISASFSSGQAKRLLTGESCGPYPTSHQLALQVREQRTFWNNLVVKLSIKNS